MEEEDDILWTCVWRFCSSTTEMMTLWTNQGKTEISGGEKKRIKQDLCLPLTFLCLLNDLPQGFLQTVSPEHQLLLGSVRLAL